MQAHPTGQVDTTRDDALGADDVTGLLRRLRRREVSAEELRAAALSRLEDANPLLNAVTCPVEELPGPSSTVEGPLHGIPTVIKDNEDLAGAPTTHGSWGTPGRTAAVSSPWVAQYLALGVQPVAKTTLSEFGLTATTETTRFGPTRNPWELGRSSGGSSGGSAALVAAGVVPIAHANDGGGSIRIPASCCGLVGLKPSRGRLVDLPGLERLPVHLGVQGVLTRTVRDTALYYSAAESVHRNPALPSIGHVQRAQPERLRIGLVAESVRGLGVSPEVRQALLRAGQLCEDLGHRVEVAQLPATDDFGPDFLRYWGFLAFALTRGGRALFGKGFDPSRTEPFTRGLAAFFLRRLDRFPASLRRLRRMSGDGAAGFDRLDVLLSPVLAHEPPPVGHLGPGVPFRTHLLRLLTYSSFTPIQNVSGGPALALPLATSASGLPIGLQLAAPVGQEARLLSLAYELEEAAPWAPTPAALV